MVFNASLAILISSATALGALPCSSVPNSKPKYDSVTKKLTGCELVSIQPDSIYEKLGLKIGDVVKPESSGNGKAMELYNNIKTEPAK